jgi:DNA-binding NarL/FixJ family response regulator
MELFTVRTSIDRATWRTLAGYVRPQRRTVLFGGLLVLLGGLAAAAQPLAAKALVDRLGTGNAITGLLVLLVGLALAGAAVAMAGDYLLERAAESVVLVARKRFARRVLSLRVPAVQRTEPGDLLSRFTSDTTLLREVCTHALVGLVTGVVTTMVMVVMMGTMDLVLLGVTAAVLLVVGLLAGAGMPMIEKATGAAQSAVGETGARMERVLGAFRTVKASGAETRETAAIEARISSRSWLSMGTPFLAVHARRGPPPADTGDPARTPRRPAADAQPTGGARVAGPRMAERIRSGETAPMVRVIVVDDEELVRSGFRLILQAAGDIEVVATVTGAQAVKEVGLHRPDVVLLDIRMPDVDGLTVLRQLRGLRNPPVVAMLTTFDSDEYIATALRSGAAGFILKDTAPAQLAQLVRTLAAGGVVLSPKVTRTVVDGYLDSGAGSPAAAQVDQLSDRERAVLVLIADGLSNADIAKRIHVSVGTVKDHVSAILTKLRVGSRVQAALVAQRAGLLGTGEASS